MYHGSNSNNLFIGGAHMINIVNKDNYKEYNIGTKAENLFKMQEKNMKVPELICLQGNDIKKDISSEIIDSILSHFTQDEITFAVRSLKLLSTDRNNLSGKVEGMRPMKPWQPIDCNKTE